MNLRRWIPILIGIVLVAFGIGFFSLIYNDSFSINNTNRRSFINIFNKDERVRIGADGIEIKDGDDHVIISWKGINVRDGKEQVDIGWDGISVNEGSTSVFRLARFGDWFRFGNISSKNLSWETVDIEKSGKIDEISNINISSSFIDIKVTEEDREDVGIHYYGNMKTSVVPELKIENMPNSLNIKLETPNVNSYAVEQSDVILEVFVPKNYKENLNVNGSSSDIYMKNLTGNKFSISSSSGDLILTNLEAEKFNIITSSGDIEMINSIGEIDITSSSGNITLDNEKLSENIKISSSSGDVSIIFSDEASYVIKGNSSSGRFTTSATMDIEGNSDKDRRFRAIIGSGEKSIEINTSSGNVHFSRR